MGWGEPHTPRPWATERARAASVLIEAVRAWGANRSTGNEERMLTALDAYDNARAEHG